MNKAVIKVLNYVNDNINVNFEIKSQRLNKNHKNYTVR